VENSILILLSKLMCPIHSERFLSASAIEPAIGFGQLLSRPHAFIHEHPVAEPTFKSPN
jgi:hypothetical protein